LEAMPAEAAESEAARRVVRTAASSAHHAAMAQPRPGVSPRTVARAAVAAGARHNAPGVTRVLIQTLVPTAPGRRPTGAGPRAGARRPPMAGRPVHHGAPGRPRAVAGRPGYRGAPGRPRAVAGRPGYRGAPGRPRAVAGRPGYHGAPGRPGYRGAPGRPGYRAAPSRPMAGGRPARRYPTRRGPGYPGAPAGQRRRPTRGAPAPRGRRGYGWGGGWYNTPWYGADGGYYDTNGAPAGAPPGAGRRPAAQASGRWVRQGRQIVLYGV
jgi:hypothetical protein